MQKAISKVILIIVFLTLTCACLIGAGTKIASFPELNLPEMFAMDDTQMYVTEKANIYIYSLKDFKLIKKFGKRGEGPQEFILNPQFPLFIDVQTDVITVHSFGKMSFFKKDGTYIREMKLPSAMLIQPQLFGKNIVSAAIQIEADGSNMMRVLSLFDKDMKKIKESYKIPHFFQRGKGLDFLSTTAQQAVRGDRLYVAWEKDMVVKVLDTDLNELFTINHKIENRKVPEKFKKDIMHWLKSENPVTRQVFDLIKPIRIADYFPAIYFFSVDDNYIYIVSFLWKGDEPKGKRDFKTFIFDHKGKFVKSIYLTVSKADILMPHPPLFHHGSFYQLVENEAEEEWELYQTKIKL